MTNGICDSFLYKCRCMYFTKLNNSRLGAENINTNVNNLNHLRHVECDVVNINKLFKMLNKYLFLLLT